LPCCCHTEHFTERELDAFRLVAAGAANHEVATALNITDSRPRSGAGGTHRGAMGTLRRASWPHRLVRDSLDAPLRHC
jgi:FixJ family two-component response regulator